MAKNLKSTKKKTKITHNFMTQKSVNILGISFLYFLLNINTFYLKDWDYNAPIALLFCFFLRVIKNHTFA